MNGCIPNEASCLECLLGLNRTPDLKGISYIQKKKSIYGNVNDNHFLYKESFAIYKRTATTDFDLNSYIFPLK